MMAKVAEEPALNSPPPPYRDLHFLRSTMRERRERTGIPPVAVRFLFLRASLPLICTFRALPFLTRIFRAQN